MRITILCSNPLHPVNAYIDRWIQSNSYEHKISLVRSKIDLPAGDVLFLISCCEIIGESDRSKYRKVLVVHASDLPKGRGWSPHIWQILDGKEQITVSLLEADDEVDSGSIWKKIIISIPKHMLWNEINHELFNAEISLIDFAVNQFDQVIPVQQDKNIESSYFPLRKPADSKIDPNESIANQFNQLRVCDPVRFPAYFELYGFKYKLTLEKINTA